MSGEAELVGYGRPPKGSRFQKGQSGNPRGRPRGRKRTLPHDHVLGQMVTVREDGKERRVTAAEAFLLHLTKRGLEGDSGAARASLAAIEKARQASCARTEGTGITRIIISSVAPGSVGAAASSLRMVTRYGQGEKGTYKLNPWIVQKAIDRMEGAVLIDEQRKVWEVTKDRGKVDWPLWWTWRGE